ncbi:MAG: hypothetical protein Greene041619_454 [Candidatus Peregrinibacteria bacterium Greene0416_19]|nr:MAG: hypothetical protein Greene041619_454 [Candidatus Peregrinibacteria bacterium Greene0416_19]
MHTQKEVAAGLQKLVFLTPDEAAGILRRSGNAPPAAIDTLLAILAEAATGQERLLMEKVHRDPGFVARFKEFARSVFDAAKNQEEASERAGTDAIFDAAP